MHTPSPKLERIRLTGTEKFTSQQKDLEFSPLDFWAWALVTSSMEILWS